MSPAREWTGKEATALCKALGMTESKYAGAVGVSVRTVANWAARPAMIPRAAVQNMLDDLLAAASPAVKVRFGELIAGQPAGPAGAQALRVAIAVVLRSDLVLLVRRRNQAAGITWQFPAGIVKPGEQAEDVAVHETLAETGVHCSVARHIGGRLHPVTGVLCDYFQCRYLGGDAANRDTVENAAVTWAPKDNVSSFIDLDMVFPPVLMILEEQHGVSAS